MVSSIDSSKHQMSFSVTGQLLMLKISLSKACLILNKLRHADHNNKKIQSSRIVTTGVRKIHYVHVQKHLQSTNHVPQVMFMPLWVPSRIGFAKLPKAQKEWNCQLKNLLIVISQAMAARVVPWTEFSPGVSVRVSLKRSVTQTKLSQLKVPMKILLLQ